VLVTSSQERAAQWTADLASWAIPDEILAQADQPPWIHPVSMFTVSDDVVADSISHQRAREALPAGGSVLDVGSGGGRAAFALVPPAAHLIAVDHQQGMLDAFAAAADQRGVAHAEYLGDWPTIAPQVPSADVVVCHHVAYNVADIVPFLQALTDHAHRRVVLELPMNHPMSNMNALWKRFWNLDRPTKPTAHDLHDVLRSLGFPAEIEVWQDPTWGKRAELTEDERIRFARIRLCLTEDRDGEIAAALQEEPNDEPRQVATLWWDTP
jgi:SAM-dependent methyltransferase